MMITNNYLPHELVCNRLQTNLDVAGGRGSVYAVYSAGELQI